MEVQVKNLLHRYYIYMTKWTEMKKMQAKCVKPSQSIGGNSRLECCGMSSVMKQSNTNQSKWK